MLAYKHLVSDIYSDVPYESYYYALTEIFVKDTLRSSVNVHVLSFKGFYSEVEESYS